LKQTINKVRITGELVKNGLEEFTTKKSGKAAIGGSLVLRTADGSEHEVDFYSNKYKEDANGNVLSEERYFYKEYLKAMQELRDISKCTDGQKPDVISISDGMFTDNDFKGQNNKVVSSNKISAKFINVVEPKDYDTTVLEAKFEVDGVIAKLEDEIEKDVPTGNKRVVINHIATRQIKEGDKYIDAYEVDKIIPVRMTIKKELVEPFTTAGYYEGCYTKLSGVVVNTVETGFEIEEQAFGEPIKRPFKRTTRLNDVKSGSNVGTIYEHDLTDDIANQLIAKRKQKLIEVENGVSSSSGSNSSAASSSTPAAAPPVMNPFAQSK